MQSIAIENRVRRTQMSLCSNWMFEYWSCPTRRQTGYRSQIELPTNLTIANVGNWPIELVAGRAHRGRF